MNRIIIDSVSIFDKRIEVKFTPSGEICNFLNYPKESVFFSEYTENISEVPYGIAVIPFVANVLPICWLTDTTLVVEELDEDFYESIPEILHGYMMMYQQTDFWGSIECKKIRSFRKNRISQKTACLFSGGVDAFATLFAHLKESPYLITLFGSDIKLTDIEGWNLVKSQVDRVAKDFNLPNPIYIKTNFRTFLKEGELTYLVRNSGDQYWHGFQHGIGISAQVAPLNYVLGISVTYMASSYTYRYRGACASDPIIESHLRFAGSRIFHDRYSYTRQDKIDLITSKCKELHKPIQLHVCWQSSGGNNCCKCEKCNRTIMGIIASGADPKDFGFSYYNKSSLPLMQRMIEDACTKSPFINFEWNLIKEKMRTNSQHKLDSDLNWIFNIKKKKQNLLKNKIHKSLSFIYHKIVSKK